MAASGRRGHSDRALSRSADLEMLARDQAARCSRLDHRVLRLRARFRLEGTALLLSQMRARLSGSTGRHASHGRCGDGSADQAQVPARRLSAVYPQLAQWQKGVQQDQVPFQGMPEKSGIVPGYAIVPLCDGYGDSSQFKPINMGTFFSPSLHGEPRKAYA
jgi:hypothetical protein